MASYWQLEKRISTLERDGEIMATTIADIKAEQAANLLILQNIVADIAGLKAKIASGSVVTAADLDALLANEKGLGTVLQATDASVPPLTPVP